MSSPTVALQGARAPRLRSVPACAYSDGQDAVDLAASAGVYLDGWQQDWLIDSLGVRPDGRWASFEVAGVVSRQNGKGEVLLARELFGLFVARERLIVHSAHLYPTAQEAFLRIKQTIENTDDLRRKCLKPRMANGEQSIQLLPQYGGGRLRFMARSKGGGRGFTGDTIILDEAYDLGAMHMAAILPTLSAVPNPQLWYTSSAGMETSDQLNAVRRRGVTGLDPRLCYLEWSAAKRPCASEACTHHPDVPGCWLDDPQAWSEANPTLGIRIDADFVQNERRAMSEAPDEFARERLGIFSDARAEAVLDMDKWDELLEPESTFTGRPAMAIDVPPSRTSISIAAAGVREDGRVHVELIEQSSLTGAAERLLDLQTKHRPTVLIIDPASPAGSLLKDLDRLGVRYATVTGREYAQACGAFYDANEAGDLAHLGQEPVNTALLAARKRTLGDAWAWDRKDNTDISPLVAVTLAKHGIDSNPGALGLIY
jgi:hypothetical protein